MKYDTLKSENNSGNLTVDLEPVREGLISTAVNFLKNSKVKHTTLIQKQQFLLSKGLTLEEIQLAYERAGVFSEDPNTVINMDISSQTHRRLALPSRQNNYEKVRTVLQSMAFLSGTGFIFLLIWKKCIKPILFGDEKKKSIEETLEKINQKVDARINELNRELAQIKRILTQQQQEHSKQFLHEFNNFKNDLEAIKGLLLNRKQFVPALSSGTPSIPPWQLTSSSHHRLSQSDDNEKADDAGSGSGSSETEVVTKNSDSSLEIM